MSISAAEIRRAQEYRDQILGRRSLFAPHIEAAVQSMIGRASILDIETGGLDPTSPIYEVGVMHGIGKDAKFKHRLVNPTTIDGSADGEISEFSKKKLTERDESLKQLTGRDNAFTGALRTEGISQTEAANFMMDEVARRDLFIQNQRHERTFQLERVGGEEFNQKARQIGLESFSSGGGVYTTPLELKKRLAHASVQRNAGDITSHLNAWEDVFTKGFMPELGKASNATRGFEIMDLTKSVFAMAQKREYMTQTGDLFTGTSVSAYAKARFGIEESHTALADDVLQGEIIRDMLGAGITMSRGEDLPDHMKDFFKNLDAMLPEQRHRNAVKNLIKTHRDQQSFLASQAEGNPDYSLLEGSRIDTEATPITHHMQYTENGTDYKSVNVPGAMRSRIVDPEKESYKYITDIDELAKHWQKTQRFGATTDYMAALAEAKETYISKYDAALTAAKGQGMDVSQSLRTALSQTEGVAVAAREAIEAKAWSTATRAPVAQATPTFVDSSRSFIKKNWKIGLVGAGVLFAANMISSDDDDYNYIEGMRHGGIAGSSRKHTTDFGSGWRGLIKLDGEMAGFIGREVSQASAFMLNKASLPGAKKLTERQVWAKIFKEQTSMTRSTREYYEDALSAAQSGNFHAGDYTTKEEAVDYYQARLAAPKDNLALLKTHGKAFFSDLKKAEQAGRQPLYISVPLMRLGAGDTSVLTSGVFGKASPAAIEETILQIKSTFGDTSPESIKKRLSANLRGAIKHERTHMESTVGRRQGQAPSGWNDLAKTVGYDQPDSWYEEYLAHKAQWEHYPTSMPADARREFFQNLQDAGHLGETPAMRRAKNRERYLARKAQKEADLSIVDTAAPTVEGRPTSNTEHSTIEGFQEESPISGKKGFGATLRKFFGFGSPWTGLRYIADDIASIPAEQYALMQAREGRRPPKIEDDREQGPEGLNPYFEGDSLATVSVDDFAVEDADTIKLFMSNGQTTSMRLAGIDAPEIEHEGQEGKIWPNQPYGQEAKATLEALLAGQSNLRAVIDPTAAETYGRPVGMLIGDNNQNINLELVRQGAAASLPYGKRKDQIFSATQFQRAEREAVANQDGMWSTQEWNIAREAQLNNKRRITNVSFTDLGRLFSNFKTSSVLMRMRNPDSDLANMQASGERSDFNTQEGMRHGWVGASRKANLTDFGSGYQIDQTKIPSTPTTYRARRKVIEGQYKANTQMRYSMKRENYINHGKG